MPEEDRYVISPDVLGPELDVLGGGWMLVEGAGLDWPIYVRMARRPTGERFVSALVVDPGSAVTSRALRNIRLDELVREYDRSLAEDYPKGGDPNNDDVVAWALVQQWDRGVPIEPSTPRRRGGPGPTDEDLRRFASLYLRQLGGGRGAAKRTAEEFGLGRTATHRYIDLCRDRGYLPPKE